MKFRYLLISFIFLLNSTILNAQKSQTIEHLQKIANSTKNDSAKAAALNQLGFEGDDYGLDGKKFTEEGLKLSTKLNIKSEKAIALLNQSQIFSKKGKYDSALIAIQKAQELYPKKDSIKHASFYSKYYFSLGMLELPQGTEKDGALKNVLNALRFAKKTNDNYLTTVCYGAVGTAYNQLRAFDKAIESNKEFLDYALKSKGNLSLAKAYNNISASYLNAGNKELYDQYSKEFEKLVPQLKNPYYNWLLVHNNALSFAEKGMIDKAVFEAKKAIELAKKAQVPPAKLMDSYYLTAYCLSLLKKNEESNQYLNEVSKIAEEIQSPEYKMYAVSGFAENYAALGDYKKTAEYLSAQISLSDSISSEKTKINSNYLHIKNKIDQKDSQLQLQEEKINRKNLLNWLFIGGLAALLAIVVLGYRNYNHRKKIQEQKITELETEKQLLATQSLLKGQEEERTRISKDLHDGLGGLLSGVKLQLGAMKGNLILTEENGNAFNHALNKLDESISEMRRVAHNMMPETLLKFGLQQALTDYSNGLSQGQNFAIDCEFFGVENRLENSVEIVVYRIVQELINNAVKHSEATKILVQVMRHDKEHLNITVEDNGKGFNFEEMKTKNSAGLQNIQSRVNYLNGKMDIQSEIGKGTSVYIECDLNQNG